MRMRSTPRWTPIWSRTLPTRFQHSATQEGHDGGRDQVDEFGTHEGEAVDGRKGNCHSDDCQCDLVRMVTLPLGDLIKVMQRAQDKALAQLPTLLPS